MSLACGFNCFWLAYFVPPNTVFIPWHVVLLMNTKKYISTSTKLLYKLCQNSYFLRELMMSINKVTKTVFNLGSVDSRFCQLLSVTCRMNTSYEVIPGKKPIYIEIYLLSLYWATLPEAWLVVKPLYKYL